MNRYNPNIHHRRSIRLKGYDYSQAGLYFVTICVQNREHLFGNIKNGEMILNDAGQMVEKWYYELENKFPDIKCDAMIVMPNHFHCIIENIGTAVGAVGADLRVCPDIADGDISGEQPHFGRTRRFAPASGGAMVQNNDDQRIHTWCKKFGLANV